jgi:hypothetical protein
MTHLDTGIRAIRDSGGLYTAGYAAICRDCDWHGELRDTYGTAAGDLWQHIKKETTP